MGLCWPLQLPPTAKAVLISLADQANDQGVCWPSLPGIVERTCFGRTAVIEAIRWLEKAGLLLVDKAVGRQNRYLLQLDRLRQRSLDEPVRQADQSGRRTSPAGGPVRQTDATRPADGLPPSGRRTTPVRQADPNRQEPSIQPSITERKKSARRSSSSPSGKEVAFLTVDDLVAEGVPEQAAVDWLVVRKAKKAPLTPTAWEAVKREAQAAGITLAEAVRFAAANNWQGFKASWWERDRAASQPARASPQRQPSRMEQRARTLSALSGGLLDVGDQHAAIADFIDV